MYSLPLSDERENFLIFFFPCVFVFDTIRWCSIRDINNRESDLLARSLLLHRHIEIHAAVTASVECHGRGNRAHLLFLSLFPSPIFVDGDCHRPPTQNMCAPSTPSATRPSLLLRSIHVIQLFGFTARLHCVVYSREYGHVSARSPLASINSYPTAASIFTHFLLYFLNTWCISFSDCPLCWPYYTRHTGIHYITYAQPSGALCVTSVTSVGWWC